MFVGYVACVEYVLDECCMCVACVLHVLHVCLSNSIWNQGVDTHLAKGGLLKNEGSLPSLPVIEDFQCNIKGL